MSCSECLDSLCECLYLLIWPIVSLVLGLVFGTIVGVEMTLMIFLITLFRLPLHIAKTLYVAATTQRCFTWCHYFDPFLRLAVILLVPVPHLLFLGGVTLCSLTCGTLFYIGKATKTIFKGRYSKAWKKSWTNIRLEKTSRLGSYIELCHEFIRDDSVSEEIIFGLKAVCSIIPGFPLGAVPFIPFTIVIVVITLYRLPINVYKTIRIALRTVTLKWDLKLCALLMLPVIHTVFPLVVLATALVGSFVFFVACTSISIAEGNSPFEEWGQFQAGIKDYYKAHEQFVGEKYLGRLDHPTGIPSGWKGQTYGLPIHQILQWQWNFLVSCALLFLGLPICLVGSTIIFGLKLIPGILSWWKKLCTELTRGSLTEVLGCWAFWFMGFLLTPAAAVAASLAATFAGTLMFLRIPHEYLKYGYKGGLYAPFGVLRDVDAWDFFCLNGHRVFACLPDKNPYQYETNGHRGGREDRKADKKARQRVAKAYWDRFANQCVLTTASLLEEGWITIEDVQGLDTSVLQTVPAIALLTILLDSVNDPEAKTAQHISWTVDGTCCEKVEQQQLDNIAALLWPKVLEAKRILQTGRKKKALAQEENADIIAALLCANTEELTEALESFLKDHKEDPKSRAGNNRLRCKLTEISLMILQVRPFQDRMQAIFSYDYAKRDVEEGESRRPHVNEETSKGAADSSASEVEPPRRNTLLSLWQSLGEETKKANPMGNDAMQK